jgi:hypothetical protein
MQLFSIDVAFVRTQISTIIRRQTEPISMLIAILGVAFSMTPAHAGTVEQAAILAEPQMQVSDGAVQGCGFRIKSAPRTLDGLTSVLVLDMSFNIYADGFAGLKGGAVRIPVKSGAPGHGTILQIQNFWMKVESERPTKPLNGEPLQAENPGYLIYVESVEAVGNLFNGVAEGKTLTVGVRLKGEGIDRIYSGVAHLSDADRRQGAQCLNDLIKKIDSGSKTSPTPQ